MSARPDYALAAGRVGSFAWAKAKMEARHPLGDSMTESQLEKMAEKIRSEAIRASRQLSPVPHLSDNGVEIGMDEEGRIYRLDDSTDYTPVDNTPDVARIVEANAVFNRVCERETGEIVPADVKAKKDAEKALLLAQTHRIAQKLESAGVPSYLNSEWCLWTYGVHSGEVQALPKFRRKTFLPYVAAQLREPRVRDLEFWLQSDPWARFWTLTTGKRVPLKSLRRAIKSLHRRISKLNAADFMIAAGVRIVFRATELGTVEKTREETLGNLAGLIERDESGELMFHPHAHCLVHLEKGRLSKADWTAFLVQLREYWGDWMDDGGCIRTAREAVKYLTKPGEIEHLTPNELAALDAQLSRLHLVQPLGELAEQIKRREESGLTLYPKTTKDGRIWEEQPDVNRRGKASKEKTRVAYAERDEQGRALFSGTFTESEFEREHMEQNGDTGADSCAVVARVAPAAASNRVKEPRVVVMGKRWDTARVANHPLVERLRTHTADAWAAGCALVAAEEAASQAEPIRVHTGTSTVRPARPPKVPRPPSPEFLAHIARLDANATLATR